MKKSTIRAKMWVWLILLVIPVCTMAVVSAFTVVQYKTLVGDLNRKARIIPIINELNGCIAELKTILDEHEEPVKSWGNTSYIGTDGSFLGPKHLSGIIELSQQQRFQDTFSKLKNTYKEYTDFLKGDFSVSKSSEKPESFYDDLPFEERQHIEDIGTVIGELGTRIYEEDWIKDKANLDSVIDSIRKLQYSSGILHSNVHSELENFSETAKKRLSLLMWIVLGAGGASAVLLVSILKLSFSWIFQPLQVLIDGSRLVASGHFDHRIELHTNDEISELAEAMNDMTERFESVCHDLDEQVRIRTGEAIRSERLASVGFLAAGIAHEINNPLASIAMCAESLQDRVKPLLENSTAAKDSEIIDRYLRMIQEEAFRCKEITEKLLDLSRAEKNHRERTNLTSLIFEMSEMISQHEKYKKKSLVLDMPEPVIAMLNPQEMKQVTINLLSNALDAISPGGSVRVFLRAEGKMIRLRVEDDGCGMDEEVLENLFEPFYTNRKYGQGNGLGLSITHRIITDHGGRISAKSPGPGKGSVFIVELPIDGVRKQ